MNCEKCGNSQLPFVCAKCGSPAKSAKLCPGGTYQAYQTQWDDEARGNIERTDLPRVTRLVCMDNFYMSNGEYVAEKRQHLHCACDCDNTWIETPLDARPKENLKFKMTTIKNFGRKKRARNSK